MMVRQHNKASTPARSGHTGRFELDRSGRITEWDEGAAAVIGVSVDAAAGRPCHEIVSGVDDFGQPVCGSDCRAWQALRQGHIRGGAAIVVRNPAGERRRLRCELTALPSFPGGALGRLCSMDAGGRALADDLAGVASLVATLGDASLHAGAGRALDFLLGATAGEAAEVFLAEPEGRGMVLTCHKGRFRQAFARMVRFDRGEGFPGLVLAHGKPIYTDRLPEDPRYLREQVKEQGFQCYLGVPLAGLSGVVGSIGLAFRRTGVDLDRCLRLMHWVGAPLSLLIEAELARLRTAIDGQFRANAGDPETQFVQGTQSALEQLAQLSRSAGAELRILSGSAPEPWVTGRARALPRCPELKAGPISQCPCLKDGNAAILGKTLANCPAGCQRVGPFEGTLYCVPLVASPGAFGLVRLLAKPSKGGASGDYLALLESAAAAAADRIYTLQEHLAHARIADSAARARLRYADASAETGPPGWMTVGEQPGSKGRNAPALPPLAIRCFGTFELWVRGVAVTPARVQRKKVLTLLKILLARPGQVHSKDALIEALWPDADPVARSGQFFVLVHELRKLVEAAGSRPNRWQFICSDQDLYYFDADSPCAVDMLEFRQMIEAGRRAEAAGDEPAASAAYERAVALYRGDFLEDEAFAEWCWLEREQLREDCLGASRNIAVLLGRCGQWERSIRHLQRALRLDPVREELHRELMHALWAAGRRTEAIRQYERCAALLAQELSVAPLPETRELLRKIRAKSS